MLLRGNKVIGVGDKKRYVIDYGMWLLGHPTKTPEEWER